MHLSDQPVWLCSPRSLSAIGRRDAAQQRQERTGKCFNLPMKQVATAGLLLVLCLVSVAQESDTTFKVDVKLVNVFVTVTDEHGAPDRLPEER